MLKNEKLEGCLFTSAYYQIRKVLFNLTKNLLQNKKACSNSTGEELITSDPPSPQNIFLCASMNPPPVLKFYPISKENFKGEKGRYLTAALKMKK